MKRSITFSLVLAMTLTYSSRVNSETVTQVVNLRSLPFDVFYAVIHDQLRLNPRILNDDLHRVQVTNGNWVVSYRNDQSLRFYLQAFSEIFPYLGRENPVLTRLAIYALDPSSLVAVAKNGWDDRTTTFDRRSLDYVLRTLLRHRNTTFLLLQACKLVEVGGNSTNKQWNDRYEHAGLTRKDRNRDMKILERMFGLGDETDASRIELVDRLTRVGLIGLLEMTATLAYNHTDFPPDLSVVHLETEFGRMLAQGRQAITRRWLRVLIQALNRIRLNLALSREPVRVTTIEDLFDSVEYARQMWEIYGDNDDASRQMGRSTRHALFQLRQWATQVRQTSKLDSESPPR